jgi:hypothetical protein
MSVCFTTHFEQMFMNTSWFTFNNENLSHCSLFCTLVSAILEFTVLLSSVNETVVITVPIYFETTKYYMVWEGKEFIRLVVSIMWHSFQVQ